MCTNREIDQHNTCDTSQQVSTQQQNNTKTRNWSRLHRNSIEAFLQQSISNKKKEEDDPTEGVETQHQFLQMFHERKKQQLL